MRLLAFLLLVLCLPEAHAQACGVGFGNAGGRLTYTANGGQVTALPRITDAAFREAWGGTLDLSGGVVRASGQVAAAVGTGAAAATACMTASRTLSLAAVARGAARAIPAVGTGIILVDIANSIRCRGQNSSVLYGAGLECDPGEAPQVVAATVWVVAGHSALGTHASPALACQAFYAQANASAGYTQWQYVGTSPSGANFFCVANQLNSSGGVVEANRNHGHVEPQAGTVETCPFDGSTLGGRPFCPTGTWEPATPEFVADRIASHPAFTANPADVAEEAIGRGHDYTPDASSPAELSGPASVNGPTTTTTTTTGGGAPSTRTQTPSHSITYGGDSYSYTTNITTIEGDTTTVTNQAPEIEVCGLPGTPPCKIDETGTPTVAQMGQAHAELDAAAAQLRDKVTEQATPRALPWLWGGISMPAGACSNLVAPSPHASIPDGEIDLCGQPWVSWWRAAWAVFCGIWCVAYCWRRFSDTVEGSAA